MQQEYVNDTRKEIMKIKGISAVSNIIECFIADATEYLSQNNDDE